jgi:uncharacterized protein YcfJ
MASMPGIVIKIGVDAANAVKNLDKVGKALDRQATRADKARLAWKKTAAGLATAGAAFVAVAGASVNAFIDDQKEAALLENTLQNMGFAAATTEVNAFIDALQFSANVSETVLRPAYSQLLRATGDVTKAEGALKLALDISAGTGKDLATVSTALSRGYLGNTTSLSRLNAGLDKSILKSGDMTVIAQALADKFGGASDASANTLSGSIAGVQIAVDELSESFGSGLVQGLALGSDSLADVEQKLRDTQGTVESFGETVGTMAMGAAAGFDFLRQTVTSWTYGMVGQMNNLYDGWVDVADRMGIISDAEGQAERDARAYRDAAQEAAYYEDLLGGKIAATGAAATASAAGLNAHAAAIDNVTSSMMKLGDAYTSSNYFGGTPTAGYDREATTLAILASRKAAAAKRAAARAKKKSDRINAVKNAKQLQDTFRRAGARTGTHNIDAVDSNRRSC